MSNQQATVNKVVNMSATMYNGGGGGGGPTSTTKKSPGHQEEPAADRTPASKKVENEIIKMDSEGENTMVGGINVVHSGLATIENGKISPLHSYKLKVVNDQIFRDTLKQFPYLHPMVTSKMKNGTVKGSVLKNMSPVRGKDKTGPLFEVMTMLPLIPLKNH